MSETKRPQPQSLRRSLLRLGIIAVSTLIAFMLVLMLFQRRLIYHPHQVDAINPEAAQLPPGRVRTISMQTTDGLTLNGWHVLAEDATAVTDDDADAALKSGRPVLLYFSGNAANRVNRAYKFRTLAGLGAEIVVFDYRGYGENPGSPSEAKLADDAQSAWRYLTQTRGVPADCIVIYGESLGGGVATRLAADLCQSQTPPAGLVLSATFSELTAAAHYHFPFLPVSWLLVDRYASQQRISQVTCPLLQLHGRRDSIVPFELGRALFEAAPEKSSNGRWKRFVELPRANHNDILEIEGTAYCEALAAFLRADH